MATGTRKDVELMAAKKTGGRGLEARLERLEALRAAPKQGRVHRVIADRETESAARQRYEHQTGLRIQAEDLVILRTIVYPRQESE